jgi:hypothetical protein
VADFLVTLAKAVVSDLNETSFSREFTAVRRMVPVYTLDEDEENTDGDPALSATQPSVAVYIGGEDSELESRSLTRYTCMIHVAVLQRVNPDDLDASDSLMDFMRELKDHYQPGHTLPDYPEATWLPTISNEMVYVPDDLERRQFTSVLRLTFLVWA